MSDEACRVLVTGGTGMVGSHLVRLLSSDGVPRQLILTNRGVPPSDLQASAQVQHWTMDLTDRIVLPTHVHTVIHIAGEKRDGNRMWAVNHLGTERLVEAAARGGVRRFVYLSSVGVYGAPKHAGIVDASHARTPNNAYEASKNAGELAVRQLCARFGMDFVVIQPTNVLGYVPGHVYPLLGLMSTIKSGKFAFFGASEAWVNYVDVGDVAAAIAAATRSRTNGATYIVNTPATLAEFVGWISRALDVAVADRHIPGWIGASAGFAGSLYQRLTGRGAPFNLERYRELTNTTRYEGGALSKDLGFDYPVGIEAAVVRLVLAYREEGRI
ncbi:MAG: NAD-dependent epimerase/dehydratase family protein [Ramlibacter sp.]|nr:NAD-dependent epimerase/dehydratase family protein [Ramlibacter sp.]